MDADAFWHVIETSAAGAGGEDALCERLIAHLEALEPEAILAFHREFSKRVHEAHRFDLMAVANIVNGGLSGEDYDAFVGWLIQKGRAYFEAALSEPALAAAGAGPATAKSRALWQAPAIAYERRTGQSDFEMEATPISLVMQGERLRADEVIARFGALVERFGWTPPPHDA